MPTAKRVKSKKKVSRSARPASHSPVAAVSSTVTLMCNGQVISSLQAANETIGEVANKLAMSQGLKSYSVRLNGVPVDAETAKGLIKGNKTLEVYAKDTRG